MKTKSKENLKFNIYINQFGIKEAGLLYPITDLDDWAILYYIKAFEDGGNAKTYTKGFKVYIWIDYSYLKKEMPMIGIKRANNFSYKIGKLVKLGLIEKEVIFDEENKKRTYVRLTQLARDCIAGKEVKVTNLIGAQATLPNLMGVSKPTESSVRPNLMGVYNYSVNDYSVNDSLVRVSEKEETVKEKPTEKEDTEMTEQTDIKPACFGVFGKYRPQSPDCYLCKWSIGENKGLCRHTGIDNLKRESVN